MRESHGVEILPGVFGVVVRPAEMAPVLPDSSSSFNESCAPANQQGSLVVSDGLVVQRDWNRRQLRREIKRIFKVA